MQGVRKTELYCLFKIVIKIIQAFELMKILYVSILPPMQI